MGGKTELYCGIGKLKANCKRLSEQNAELRSTLKDCQRYIERQHLMGIGDKVDILKDITSTLRDTENATNN